MDWQPIETAPKDGTDILICLPTGTSDHYYPVCWVDADEDDGVDESCWQCRWREEMILTEEQICGCYLKPMWTRLEHPPSSLCSGAGIKNDQYTGR